MGNGMIISMMWRTMNNIVIITVTNISSELESYSCKFMKEYVRITNEKFLHNCLFRDISSLEGSDVNPLEYSIASGQDILDRDHINLQISEWAGKTTWIGDFPWAESPFCPRRNWGWDEHFGTHRFSRSPIKPHQNASLMVTWSCFSFLFLSG